MGCGASFSDGVDRGNLYLGVLFGRRRHKRYSRHYTTVDPDPDPCDYHGQGGAFPEQRRSVKEMIEKTFEQEFLRFIACLADVLDK